MLASIPSPRATASSDGNYKILDFSSRILHFLLSCGFDPSSSSMIADPSKELVDAASGFAS